MKPHWKPESPKTGQTKKFPNAQKPTISSQTNKLSLERQHILISNQSYQ